MPGHIQFLEDVGKRKKGETSRWGENTDFSEATMRLLVADRLVKEIDSDELTRAIEDARFARLETSITETLRNSLAGSRSAPKGPPSGGGKLIDQLRGDSVPEEEQDRNRGFRDALKCVFFVEAQKTPQKMRDYALKRMRNYVDDIPVYEEDEEGNITVTRTLTHEDGSIEKYIRTGTDALSGGQTYGFTLKPTYVSNLFEIAQQASVFAQGTQPVPVTDGNEAIWPGLQQFQAPVTLNGVPQPASFGGITFSWVGETTARVSSDAKTFENRFPVRDLTGFTSFSRDYIMDSSTYIPMDTVVTRKFADGYGWMKDWHYIQGDGNGKPLGYFNCLSTQTGGPSSGGRYNSNGTPCYNDLVWMLSHIDPMCRSDARFIAHISTYPSIAALKDSSGNYVFQPNALINQEMVQAAVKTNKVENGGMTAFVGGVILGHLILYSEKVPQVGTTGDISVACPWQYGDATKLRFEIGVSEHFYFSTDEIAYRTKARFYGRSLWPDVYTDASDPTSPSSGWQTGPAVVLGAYV
jgi:HK97 family phage major capsid protein